MPHIEVDSSLPARRVIRALELLKQQRELSKQLRLNNGPELISSTLTDWCDTNGIQLHYIQPGKPTQNGFVEPFNGGVS